MGTGRTFNDNHHSCRQVFTATKLNENIEVTLDTNFDSLLSQVREAFNSKIHRIVSSLRDGHQVNFKECLEDLQALSSQHTNEILDGIKKSFKELSASHTKEVNEHLEKSIDHLSSGLRMKQKREENIWKRRLNTCRIATKIEKNNDTYLNKTLLDDAHRESSLLHTREVNNVSTALQKVGHNLEEREEENRILTKINKDFEKKAREMDELLRKNVLHLQRSEEESKKLEKEMGRIQNKLAKSVFSEACLKTKLENTNKHAVSLEVQLKVSRHREAELEDDVLILKSKTEEQANESKELKKKIRVLKTISIDSIAVRRSSKAVIKQPATEMCGSTSSISAKCELGMKVHSIKQKTSNYHIQENINVSATCFDSNDTKIGHDDKLPSNVITFLDEKCALIKGLENILFVKEKEMSQMKKSTQGCIKKIEAYENILKPKHLILVLLLDKAARLRLDSGKELSNLSLCGRSLKETKCDNSVELTYCSREAKYPSYILEKSENIRKEVNGTDSSATPLVKNAPVIGRYSTQKAKRMTIQANETIESILQQRKKTSIK